MASMLDGCTPWPREFVDRYWAAGHWDGSTLDNLLRGWALQYGPRTALVHGGTRLTYANLNRRADRMAAGFRLRGLRPGMRVVVQLPNVPEFVVGVFALMRAGVVPVLCPVSYPASEVPELVRVTQAVGYVGPAAYRGTDHTAMAAGIAARWPFLRRVFTYEAPGTESPYGGMTTDPSNCQYAPLGSIDAAPEPALPPDAGKVAFLLLGDGDGDGDGGGGPVLVPRTHNDFAYQARAAAGLVSLTEDDVYLAALPAASVFALGCPGIVGTLAAGGTVVLADGTDPAVCLPLVERERVTVTSLPPEAAAAWVDALPSVRADVSSLRLVQTGGGAPPPPAAAGRLAAGLGAARAQQVFAPAGGPVVLADGTAPGVQGRPLSPDDEIRLVGADGREVPDGEPGELLARGPYTPRGHYRPAGDAARRFTPDGYFRTGALALRTADGGLVVTGRVPEPPAG